MLQQHPQTVPSVQHEAQVNHRIPAVIKLINCIIRSTSANKAKNNQSIEVLQVQTHGNSERLFLNLCLLAISKSRSF